ncbi:MAG: pantoate--beta-alanine ligase, partial [Sphingobacteriales bacterium]
KYPRTLEADAEKIKQVSHDIIVFAPEVDEMYDGNTQSQHYDFDGLEHQMEGAHRPGHFDGVGTIVKKLVEKNNMPINVVGCPITREASGLAMSSRNERLTAHERGNAAFIYQTLEQARERFKTESIADVKDYVNHAFASHPEFKPDYFEIAAEDTLLPATLKENTKYRAFVAVFLGNVRLIDNISLN